MVYLFICICTRRTTATTVQHAMVEKQKSLFFYNSCKLYKITKITKNPARKTIDQLDKNSNG
jgi:hypothetical protein